MSQQPPQWSPLAVQIFTTARQITQPEARVAYISQACGANAHLRWEVDWLLNWEQSQQGPPADPVTAIPANSYVTPHTVPMAAMGNAQPAKTRRGMGWGWIVAICSIAFLFLGFLGIFIYGAYRGMTHLQFEREVASIERTARAQAEAQDYDDAARSYERLVEIRTKQYGENHEEISEAIANAASAWYYDREFGKAAQQYEKAYQLDLKRVGPKDKRTLKNQDYWGIALREDNKLAQALDVFKQVLVVRKDSLGPHHEDTAESLINVGYCLETMGESTEAIATYEPAYEGLKKKFSPNHKDAIGTIRAIVRCYDDIGRFDEATAMLTKNYEGLKSAAGIDGAQIERIRESLCDRLEKDQEWERLVKVRQEVVDDRKNRGGDDLTQIAQAQEQLANALIKQGQFDKAIELLVDCCDKLKTVQGDEGKDFMKSLHVLADAHKSAGAPEKGVAIFQELHDQRSKRLGPKSSATLEVAAQIGWRMILAGDVAGGEAQMEKALDDATNAMGLQHETTQGNALALAQHYRKTRQFSKETEIRRRLSAQQQKTAGIEDETTRERLESHADAELEAGNMDAAIEIYRKLYDFEINHSGAAGHSTLYQARLLVLAYVRAKQLQKAIDLSADAVALLQRRKDDGYWNSWSGADLGMMFARAGISDKACQAYEVAAQNRVSANYAQEEDFEKKFLLWPAQASSAKLTTPARKMLAAKKEEVAKTHGPISYHANALKMQLAMFADADGALPEAEKIYRELISSSKGKSIGWHSQGLILLAGNLRRQGKLPESEAAAREAIELKKTIDRHAVNPGAEQQIMTTTDAELELADCLIAQDKLPEAETLLLSIHDAKAKLDFLEERFWDVRSRAQAVIRLMKVHEKMGKTSELDKWKAELESLEAGYPGASRA